MPSKANKSKINNDMTKIVKNHCRIKDDKKKNKKSTCTMYQLASGFKFETLVNESKSVADQVTWAFKDPRQNPSIPNKTPTKPAKEVRARERVSRRRSAESPRVASPGAGRGGVADPCSTSVRTRPSVQNVRAKIKILFTYSFSPL